MTDNRAGREKDNPVSYHVGAHLIITGELPPGLRLSISAEISGVPAPSSIGEYFLHMTQPGRIGSIIDVKA